MKKELGRVTGDFGGTAGVGIKLVAPAALALVLCLGLSFRVMAQEISATKAPVSTLRVARPTDNLPEVIKFYRDGLGLEVLASFSSHHDFDGVILGRKGFPYHLEFTHKRGHKVGQAPSQDNLLVFYVPDKVEWRNAVERMQKHGYEPVKSYNPWWDDGGKTFADIDGYRVVLYNKKWDK
jgi:catechol 2,3-dioxygenase-like lactoylglutathione lyase family enzyme